MFGIITFYLCLFFIGAALSSFFALLIYRRETFESSLWERSHCDFCGKELKIYCLVPFFHYFILRGKSACCQKKLPLKYPISEFLGGCILIIIFTITDTYKQAIGYGVIYLGLYYLSLWDAYKGYAYQIDYFTIFLVVGISSFSFLGFLNIWGMILFGGIFLLISYFLPEKMGRGDGLYVGILSLFESNIVSNYYSITFGLAMGAIFGLFILYTKKQDQSFQLPMYPFFFLGSFIHFLLKFAIIKI